jgi:hypothetical protein
MVPKINGTCYYPILYSPPFCISRSPYVPGGKTNYTHFTQAGVDLFEMHIDLRNAWKPDGTLSIAMIDHEITDVLRGILAINPRAFFQIRLDFHAPHWWLKIYPEELVKYARGPINFDTLNDIVRAPNASLASERWREEASQILKQFLDYLDTTDVGKRVYSFMVGGGCGSEWHYVGYKQEPDTGEAMTRHFRRWLSDKYGTDRALQEAWNRPDATLAAATVPDLDERCYHTGVFRDPQKERRIIDYFHCHQETVEDAINYFTRFLKGNWPRKALVGLFNGYLFSDNDFNANGHLYFDRLLDSPYIDFFAGPFNYNTDAREIGGTAQQRSLVESIRLHGKLFMTEQDRCTHLMQEHIGTPDEFGHRNDDESIATIRSHFAQSISRASGFWFEELSAFPGYPPHWHVPRDTVNGNWNTPAMMNEIKRLKSFCDGLLKREYEPAADVAFIYDFPSYYYMAETDNRQTREIQYASNNWMTSDAYRSGAAFDTYLLSDLPLIDIDRYRVIIFGTVWCMSDEQMDFINREIKKDGRTVVFNYAPAYTDGERLDINRIRAITEMDVRPLKMDTPPVMTVNGRDYGLEADGSAGRVPVAPLFAIDDPQVEVLGHYKDSPISAIARRKQADYTVVYAALPLRDPCLMRQLFREAGAHIYSETNDVIMAGGGTVCMATRRDAGGRKIIRLRNGKDVEITMKPASTVILDAQTGQRIFE